jgi:hypothetical protein
MLVGELQRISDAKKQLFITPGFLPSRPSLKMAGSQLKRLVSTGHFKELVKQVTI